MPASSRRCYWLGAILACALLLLLYGALHSSRSVPVYQGKTLYQWSSALRQAQQENYLGPNRPQTVQTASTAILSMGTNALPFILADLQAKPTLYDRALAWLARYAPFLKLKPANIEDRWGRAICALEILGPTLKPFPKPDLSTLVAMASNSTGYAESALMAVGPDALPPFTNLLAGSTFPRTGNLIGAFANSVYAGRIKPEEAAVALPYILRVFTSKDTHGRWYAASAIGAIHQQPDLCVPLLIDGLADPNASTRSACVESLGRFGEAANPHAARLADTFDQADAMTRRAICGALASFHSTNAIAVAVPVLARGLRDKDESVRIWAATGLGQLGAFPEQSVPALLNSLQDSSPIVRMMAIQSLIHFPGQAPNTVPALQLACLDSQSSVRIAATNALAQLRSKP